MIKIFNESKLENLSSVSSTKQPPKINSFPEKINKQWQNFYFFSFLRGKMKYFLLFITYFLFSTNSFRYNKNSYSFFKWFRQKRLRAKNVLVPLASYLVPILLNSTSAFTQTYWEEIPGVPNNIGCMAVDARNGNLWTGGEYIYLYNGTIWTNKGNFCDRIYSITVAPNGDIYAGFRDITDGKHYMCKSTDGGNSWINVFNAGSQIQCILITGSGDNYNVYFGTGGYGVYVPNGSGNWIQANAGLVDGGSGYATIVNSLVFGADGATLYVGTSNGVYRSTNGGNNWAGPLPGTNGLNVFELAVVDDNTIFAATFDHGLYKSGNTWAQVGTSINALSSSMRIIYNSTTGHIFAQGDNGGHIVFRSSDLGVSWENVNAGISDPYINGFAFDPITGQTYVSSSSKVYISVIANMVVSPTSLDFGSIEVGDFFEQTLTIKNSGNTTLVVSSISLPANFTLPNGESTINIEPDDEYELEVQFTPTATIGYSGDIVITHNGFDSPTTVPLSGAGIIFAVDIAPEHIDFGTIKLGTPKEESVTITNSGMGDITITNATISGDDATSFLHDFNNRITLKPNETKIIRVTFNPNTLGKKNGLLTVNHSIGDKYPLTVTLTGTGEGPVINITPFVLEFKDALIDSTNTKTLTISNDGDLDLEIKSFTLTGANANMFTLVSGYNLPITVAPSESIDLTLQFLPTSIGEKSARLEIIHNGHTSPSIVQLTGRGVAPNIIATPNPLDFGDVAIRTSFFRNITIQNSGTADLVISEVSINRTAFTLLNVTTPRTVEVGGRFTIAIHFYPTVVGSHTGTLTLTHNAPTAGTVSIIPLSGTGVASVAVITINTTSLNFNNVQINQSKDLSIVIGNTGNVNLEISSITTTGTNASLFTVVGNSTNITVNPHDSHTVTIRFTPNETGAKSATLRIVSTNAEERTVTLSGNAVISVNEPEEIPNTYNLMQNYPNPFNPTTKIQYSLPEVSYVRLSVYNSMGQEMMQLVNETQSAGKYIVDLNAQNLQSGVYLYRLQTSKFVDTKKMLLIK